ncbi:nucleoside hydrolase [Dactylosporangium sp. AC04546]|uniref:nucleoside hydrolase n=1 Tax=Dactylosporangium sp. AC04546 TaxID=2862460 RepID=UPI001EDF29E0|nr:nucleoside hydrolase [Dactylosporangium sp. AC04546]WVK88692.1 nucleoside hydrolase [Dactylosporangium sp. AC04546]
MTFVLDTDIGTDVDDVLALAVGLGSPELTIAAVTTVYGDVHLRARLAAHTLATAGVAAPPVVPGIEQPRSGRPVWWAGHEGKHLPASAHLWQPPALDPIGVLAAAPVVAAIGPLTNLAAALDRPQHGIGRIAVMGGEFRDGVVEHNMRCDIAAAEVVFDSGTPLTVVGLDQTERLRITAATLDRLRNGSALSSLLETEIREFWAFAGQDFNVPHDPIVIVALARPELFEVRRGRIRIDADGPSAGRTTFEPDDAGPHDVVVDFDLDGVAEEITSRLIRATSLSA